MRIVTSVKDGKLEFRVESLDNVDVVEVVTPRHKSFYFDNTPRNVRVARRRSDFAILANVAEPRRWWHCSQRHVDAKCNFIHYLMYSNDEQDEYPLDLDALGYSLWKCIKWKVFKNDKAFGKDALVYNFVTNTFIRFTPECPVRLHENGKWTYENDQTLHNCKPLVQIRQALTTRIISVDGALEVSPKVATSPPNYDDVEGSAPPLTPRTLAALRIFV